MIMCAGFLIKNFLSQSAQIKRQRLINSGRIISVPHKFAVIDSEDVIESAQVLFEFMDVYWVSKSIIDPRLVSRKCWYARNNYLHPFLVEKFAHILGSGLTGWWGNSESVRFGEELSKEKVKGMVRKIIQDKLANSYRA